MGSFNCWEFEDLPIAESLMSQMLFAIHFGDGSVTNGKLNVCDFAGSERLGKSGTHHVGVSALSVSTRSEWSIFFLTLLCFINVQGVLEEKKPNVSRRVLAVFRRLRYVIERLQPGEKKNVPFRESKLELSFEFLLKDSLSGNSKTLTIVCCNIGAFQQKPQQLAVSVSLPSSTASTSRQLPTFSC